MPVLDHIRFDRGTEPDPIFVVPGRTFMARVVSLRNVVAEIADGVSLIIWRIGFERVGVQDGVV